MNLKPEDKANYDREWKEIRQRLDAATDPKVAKKCRQELSALANKYANLAVVDTPSFNDRRQELEAELIIAAQNLMDFMGCSACSLPMDDGRIVEIREPDDGK